MGIEETSGARVAALTRNYLSRYNPFMVQLPRRLAAAAIVTAFLAGCQGTMPSVPGSGQTRTKPSDLVFGIHWIGGTPSETAARNIQRTSGLPNVVPLANEAAAAGVDVIVRLTYKSSYIQIETFAGGTKKTLTEGRASWWTQSAGWRDIGNHLVSNFPAGGPMHAEVLAERAKAQPAGGVTRSDLEAVVKQAMASAGNPKPEASPAPRSDADAPRYKAGERPDDYAVVIGIEKYSDLPEARFAENDAAAVRDHLAALGIPERNIVSLVGAKAGKAAFMKTFETWLPRNAGPESTVWVYYSGHGAPDPGTGQAYLLPWDGDPQFLDDTGYPLKRLYAKLEALPAKRVIVALDSCFSGAGGRSVLAKGTRPLVSKMDLSVPGSKIVAITASASDQVSGTLEDQGHGLFTYHFLSGLNGAAADTRGRVTLDGLYGYLQPKVADSARRQNRDQTPQLLPRREAAAAILLR